MTLFRNPYRRSHWPRTGIFAALATIAATAAIGAHAEARHEAAAPHPAAAAHAPAVGAHGGPAHAEMGRPGMREMGRAGPGHHEMARHEIGRHEMMREHHVFHEHDVRRFGHADLEHWRGGRWNNSCRDGRCGWWWFSSGQYYYYDRPTYPYPLAVSSVAFMEPVAVVAQPPVVVQQVQQAAPQPVAAGPKFSYYCDSPKGYYPQVPSCPTGYREVTGR